VIETITQKKLRN